MDATAGGIAGLIPAAGLSRRMGAFKPLLPFRGGTVIEAAAETLLSGGADRVIVVTGYRGEELEAVLSGSFPQRVRCVHNPDYAGTDMLRSVQLGCGALAPCEAFFLLPGDMPAVRPETLRALLAARPAKPPYVLFPVLAGRRRHPPLISGDRIPAILAFREEGGLRSLWRRWEDILYAVPVEDGGVRLDLDTPEDYARLRREFDGRS